MEHFLFTFWQKQNNQEKCHSCRANNEGFQLLAISAATMSPAQSFVLWWLTVMLLGAGFYPEGVIVSWITPGKFSLQPSTDN